MNGTVTSQINVTTVISDLLNIDTLHGVTNKTDPVTLDRVSLPTPYSKRLFLVYKITVSRSLFKLISRLYFTCNFILSLIKEKTITTDPCKIGYENLHLCNLRKD